jgi:hypothetical protein
MFQVVIIIAVIFTYKICSESALQKVQISNRQMREVAGGHVVSEQRFLYIAYFDRNRGEIGVEKPTIRPLFLRNQDW